MRIRACCPQSQLQGAKVDPKQMQLYLTGFLEKHTSGFMKSLWELLISAQQNPLGIPGEFLEAKKEEIRKKKEEQVPTSSSFRFVVEKGASPPLLRCRRRRHVSVLMPCLRA